MWERLLQTVSTLIKMKPSEVSFYTRTRKHIVLALWLSCFPMSVPYVPNCYTLALLSSSLIPDSLSSFYLCSQVQVVGNMRLKIPDFNLRQNINSNATANSNRIENWQSKMNQNILMLNSITLTKQRSVLMKRRCSADCSSAERSRSVSSGRAVALPRNLIAVPRAGFTTARVRRYRSPFSSVHAKGRAGEI